MIPVGTKVSYLVSGVRKWGEIIVHVPPTNKYLVSQDGAPTTQRYIAETALTAPSPAPSQGWRGEFYKAFQEIQAYDAQNLDAQTYTPDALARVRPAVYLGKPASRHEVRQGEIWGDAHRADIYASNDATPITDGSTWRFTIPFALPDTTGERFAYHVPQMHNYLWDLHSSVSGTPDNPHGIFVDSWEMPHRLVYRCTGGTGVGRDFNLLDLTTTAGTRLPGAFNRWITVELTIRFSTTANGSVKVVRDGQLIGEANTPTLYPGDKPYWKQALYFGRNYNGGRSVVYHGVGQAVPL